MKNQTCSVVTLGETLLVFVGYKFPRYDPLTPIKISRACRFWGVKIFKIADIKMGQGIISAGGESASGRNHPSEDSKLKTEGSFIFLLNSLSSFFFLSSHLNVKEPSAKRFIKDCLWFDFAPFDLAQGQ